MGDCIIAGGGCETSVGGGGWVRRPVLDVLSTLVPASNESHLKPMLACELVEHAVRVVS